MRGRVRQRAATGTCGVSIDGYDISEPLLQCCVRDAQQADKRVVESGVATAVFELERVFRVRVPVVLWKTNAHLHNRYARVQGTVGTSD